MKRFILKRYGNLFSFKKKKKGKKEILAFRSNSVRRWTIREESVCSAGRLQSRFRRDKQKKMVAQLEGKPDAV